MFRVLVFIFCIFESIESSCINQYSLLTSSPVLISGNILEIQPRYYANCSGLTTVNLNAIGTSVKLDSLDFVKYLPTSVTFLDASNNKISELPRLINAVHLKTMLLINNKISDITYISEFRYLESIDLAENKIKFLPEITLSNLKRLVLRKNAIKSIKPFNLRSSPNIETLYLDENVLTEIRVCEFKNQITITATENPNFRCKKVVCSNCVCTATIGNRTDRVEFGRDNDVCPDETEIYFIVIGVVVLALFIAVGLTCVIRWKRRMNRRIQEELQDHNPLSMPMEPMTPPPRYEARNYQNSQVLDEISHGNPLGNANYDYVYDHFRKKRHLRPHQQNNPW